MTERTLTSLEQVLAQKPIPWLERASMQVGVWLLELETGLEPKVMLEV